MNEEQVYDRVRMQGPTRLPDGSVEVIEFYGRLTAREVGFRLPYHGVASPLRLRLRCHRFGLEGTVHLRVNGEPLDSFVFTDRSYLCLLFIHPGAPNLISLRSAGTMPA